MDLPQDYDKATYFSSTCIHELNMTKQQLNQDVRQARHLP
jgi:hypothetical protein